jgi:hypothetical protein
MQARYGLLALALLGASVPLLITRKAQASDHADTPEIAANPGTDITDVYIFPSPENPDNVVLIMNVNPLITPAQADSTSFDPNVLYQFKIDTNGDSIEDRVIQVTFEGTGSAQIVKVVGPVAPPQTGALNSKLPALSTTGVINQTFTVPGGLKVFAGVREDSFFFDLERFFEILPDRATPLTGIVVPNPNQPQATTWRAPGDAVDFLSNGGYNVLSIVVELPKRRLARS